MIFPDKLDALTIPARLIAEIRPKNYPRLSVREVTAHKGHYQGESLIRFALVHQPSCDMSALWVVVRPVDDAAFCVPDVLTAEANAVAYRKPVNARGDVDVVSD